MFYTEPYHLQRGAGIFEVDRYPLQRGRGLGGVFANLLRKIIPYGKTFVKAAASSGKKVLQSELGKQILNDPEKHFTEELLNRIDEVADKEFSYGKGDDAESSADEPATEEVEG